MRVEGVTTPAPYPESGVGDDHRLVLISSTRLFETLSENFKESDVADVARVLACS